MAVPELEELRRSIDAVDEKIVALLAERIRLVLSVGDVKRVHRIPVHDPDRERHILDRLAARAVPPLDALLLRRVYEQLIEEAKRLEHDHVER